VITWAIIMTIITSIGILFCKKDDEVLSVLLVFGFFTFTAWAAYSHPGATYSLVLSIIATIISTLGVVSMMKDKDIGFSVVIMAFCCASWWVPWSLGG